MPDTRSLANTRRSASAVTERVSMRSSVDESG